MAGGLTFTERKLAAVLHQIEEFFLSSIGTFIAVMMCLVLFFAAVGAVSLYIHKRDHTSSEMDLAMKAIRDFMIKEKPSLQGRNDSEILAEAEKLAGELLIWADRANEVQSAINDLTSKHYQKWQAYKEALYLFDEALVFSFDAERLCESKKSKLIIIENEKEEAFLENEIKNEQQDFWIGLYYTSGWKWIDGTALRRGYWGVNKPGDPFYGPAGAIKAKCATPLQCWDNFPRLYKKRSICKKKPDKRWFN